MTIHNFRYLIHPSRNKACFIAFFLFFSIQADDITEDAANSGFHFLEEYINPRFIAMGTAGAALSGKGFSFYNPAIPFLMKKTYLSVEYGQYPKADLKHAQLEGVLSLEKWFFGLSLHNESIDNIYETNFWGNLPFYNAPFSQQFINMSLVIGFSQWSDFAFALCINGTQDRIHDEHAYALSFSGGAVYMPLPDHLTLGLSILYLGTSTPMLGADSANSWGKGEDLPLNSRFGVSWTDKLKDIPYTAAFDIVYRNVRDRSDRFTKYAKYRFAFPLGVEVWPLPPLAVRLGKRFNRPTEVINFGVGLKLDPLSVDASFVVPKLIDDAEIKWLTSITYNLRSKKTRKPRETVIFEKPLIISPQSSPSDSTIQKTEITPVSAVLPPLKDNDSTVIDSSLSDSTESFILPIDSVSIDTSQTGSSKEPADPTISQSKPLPGKDESAHQEESPALQPEKLEILTLPPVENKPADIPSSDTTRSR